jgi:peptidoglycan/LPS O-acetylase OafA/YrhL
MERDAVLTKIGRHLRRTTTSGRFIPEIDGIRFVAIASVVVFHLNGYLVARSSMHAGCRSNWLAGLAATGHCGVHLFFMVSGFILALPWLAVGSPPRLRTYFLRRFTRLEPPYFVSLVVITLAYYLTRHPPRGELVRQFLASTVYLHSTIFGKLFHPNCVTWSLETEIQFYMLLPILALTILKAAPAIRRAALLALLVLGCCVAYAVRDSMRLSVSLMGTSHFFVAGILIADLHGGWSHQERSFRWDLLGLAGFVLVPIVDLRWASIPLLPALSLIFIGALRGPVIRRALSNPLIVTIGGMCYTIYLLHYPLVAFIGPRVFTIGERFAYPLYSSIQLALVGTLMAAPIVVFFVCVERPCMDPDWPKRLRLRMFKPSAPQTEPSRSSL